MSKKLEIVEKETPVEGPLLLMLEPGQILADTNLRYGLKRSRIDAMKESILEQLGITVPVQVQRLPEEDADGHTHKLIAGHYRHAAASELTAEGAPTLVPAIEQTITDEADYLRKQITENHERENMSPMDEALAMRKLLDAGVSRNDVRRIFARPVTKKGSKQPEMASMNHSTLNLYLRLLELPKSIQEKVHLGQGLSLYAAFELGRVTPDKRDDVLKRAEGLMMAEYDRSEREEERYLAAEAKRSAAEKAKVESTQEAEAKRKLIAEGQEALKAKTKELAEAKKVKVLELPTDEQKAARERAKSLEADVKGLNKAIKTAQNELADTLEAVKKADETEAELAARLEAEEKARKNVKPVTQRAVQEAAAAEGATPLPAVNAHVSLKRGEILEAFADIAAQEVYAKVALIAQAINRLIIGELTTNLLTEELAALVGDTKKAPKKAKK